MSYEIRVYESSSPANLFATANRLVGQKWQAILFETRVQGLIFKSYVYRITFRRRLPPPAPGPISLRVAGEDSDMLRFVIQMPAKTEAEFDVVSRRVQLTVGGVDLEPQDVTVGVAEIGPFNGQQDDAVSGKCWNVDDAGNVSETASEFTGVLTDTFAPPAPGVLGIRVVGEVADPVVPPPVDEPIPPVEEPVS